MNTIVYVQTIKEPYKLITSAESYMAEEKDLLRTFSTYNDNEYPIILLNTSTFLRVYLCLSSLCVTGTACLCKVRERGGGGVDPNKTTARHAWLSSVI
jgi:hypothetical protein